MERIQARLLDMEEKHIDVYKRQIQGRKEMKNQNFYMRVISLLLVILAVLFYNSSMKAQANEKEIAALTDKVDTCLLYTSKVLVHDYEVIVNDPEVDIVVEVMGGIEPAYTFVKRALQALSLIHI